MFVLLRRWVSWAPAAFVGGLLYGFSPFVLIASTDAHLMLGMAPIPPLVVACLDEILVRQRRRPVATGGSSSGCWWLVQFFIGTEVLVLIVIAAAIGVVLVAVYGLAAPRASSGTGAATAVAALVTAAATALSSWPIPLWFALAGPAHLSGTSGGTGRTSATEGPTSPTTSFLGPLGRAPRPWATASAAIRHPPSSGQYFGLGLVVVPGPRVILWRRDRRLWLFGAFTVVSVPLSFGLTFTAGRSGGSSSGSR